MSPKKGEIVRNKVEEALQGQNKCDLEEEEQIQIQQVEEVCQVQICERNSILLSPSETDAILLSPRKTDIILLSPSEDKFNNKELSSTDYKEKVEKEETFGGDQVESHKHQFHSTDIREYFTRGDRGRFPTNSSFTNQNVAPKIGRKSSAGSSFGKRKRGIRDGQTKSILVGPIDRFLTGRRFKGDDRSDQSLVELKRDTSEQDLESGTTFEPYIKRGFLENID